MPPESLPAIRLRNSERPAAVSNSRARVSRSRSRHAEQVAVERDVLVDREIFVEAESLGHVADVMLRALRVARDVEAGHFALPESGERTPASMRIVVVLPAPSGPTKPKISPG